MSVPLEVEGKWLVKDLSAIAHKLEALGADCIQPRVYENNLRFDTPDRRLSQLGQVLRLRQDLGARFTYKSAPRVQNAIRHAVEIEFSVGDAALAWQFLEALGYEMFFQYEKYRRVYVLEDCHIMLDELPYGDFVEIEGADSAVIEALARRIGLDPAAGTAMNYTGLFQVYCEVTGRSLEQLVFAAFEGWSVTPEQLGLRYADQAG